MIDPALLEELRRVLNAFKRPEYVNDLEQAVPTDLVRSIVADNRRGGDIHGRASAFPKATNQPGEERPRSNHGWADTPPLRPPEGIDLIDRMVSAQDERDLIERAKQMAAARQARAMVEAEAMGLSHEEWSRMSEADLKARKEQQLKKSKDKA
jgi:hypothetical protein